MVAGAGQAVRPLAYMRQLDALRGLAIAAVLLEHFLPPENFIHFIPWGGIGVQLFFVLSGYLITLILLDGRDLAGAGHAHWHVLRNFYARRFLRIFPVYYLTLFVTAVLGVAAVLDMFWWLFTYLSNWYFFRYGSRDPVFHFWSLAVEEQFYLVWPWLILFLPRAWLVRAVLGAVVAAPLTRYVLFLYDLPSLSIHWSTPSCLDTLGIGALLAVFTRHPDLGLDRDKFLRNCLLVGLPLTVLLLWLNWSNSSAAASVIFLHSALALFFVWLVGSAARGFSGLAGNMMELAPLVYLGRISYGVYVFHNFLPGPVDAWLGWSPAENTALRFILLAACTVALASVSWYCFEKPINNLKKRFPYGELTLPTSPRPQKDDGLPTADQS